LTNKKRESHGLKEVWTIQFIMYKRFLKIPVLIASVAIVFSSCTKDENDSSSGSSTNGKTTAVFNSSVSYGSMTDQDDNVYKTVTIGTQTWMAENLRTTTYNDGTAIPNVTDNDSWVTSTGAYCNYNNTTSSDTIATYGRLYNWYTINTGKLAPKGWHVPTDAEWTTLTTYLGGESVSGGKLKETGTTHWISPNTGAANETGFTALPGGYRFNDGAFYGIGSFDSWWSTTEYNATLAWYRLMYFNDSDVLRDYYDKKVGMSVRCVKD
jgi:uncharacterized protein (TIGR02145 family)